MSGPHFAPLPEAFAYVVEVDPDDDPTDVDGLGLEETTAVQSAAQLVERCRTSAALRFVK